MNVALSVSANPKGITALIDLAERIDGRDVAALEPGETCHVTQPFDSFAVASPRARGVPLLQSSEAAKLLLPKSQDFSLRKNEKRNLR